MSDLQDQNKALAEKVINLARLKRLTIGTAESCTGGGIGHYLTTVPGSSKTFQGGIIAYDNGIKTGQLGVPPSLILDHGAVSREVAIAMADNLQEKFSVDLAVSVTGIAGPDGGSLAKPVGLVYIGLAKPDSESLVKEFKFGDVGRDTVRAHAANEALKMLNIYLT